MAKKLKTYEDLTEAAKQDIVVLYRGCKDQREQIKICAELNQTTLGVIRCVLEEAGMKVPPLSRPQGCAGKTGAGRGNEGERARCYYRLPFSLCPCGGTDRVLPTRRQPRRADLVSNACASAVRAGCQ